MFKKLKIIISMWNKYCDNNLTIKIDLFAKWICMYKMVISKEKIMEDFRIYDELKLVFHDEYIVIIIF
jgi:hypothetical protein